MLLTDATIARLLAEPKPTIDRAELLERLSNADPRRGHRRIKTVVRGGRSTKFTLNLRHSTFDVFDFSVILCAEYGAKDVILRRHNGLGHPHKNRIEGNRFSNVFHVHLATERYQAAGLGIDDYAEETDRFTDLATAVDAMLDAAGFSPPAQMRIQ